MRLPTPDPVAVASDASVASDWATRLSRLRERMMLTQRELAREFGVTHAAIGQWENGSRALPGPIARLVELYEQEVDPAEAEPASSRTRTPRSLRTATAVAFWLASRSIMNRTFATSLGRRVGLAACQRAVEIFGGSKGLAMKLGQTFSYMDPFMAPELRRGFAALPRTMAPLPKAVVARILFEELGASPRQLFASWEPRPFAIGSVGQVHGAVAHDGRPLVIKIQHPDIEKVIRTDLISLRVIERLYHLAFPAQRPGTFYETYAQRFLEECDYRREAQQQEQFRRWFLGRDDLVVPAVVPALSTARVLTSERCAGQSLDDFVATASQAERNAAGAALWQFHYESVFRGGAMHIDANPANLIFAPGRIAVVDFGRVQQLSPAFVENWRALLRGLLERDPRETVRQFSVLYLPRPEPCPTPTKTSARGSA